VFPSFGEYFRELPKMAESGRDWPKYCDCGEKGSRRMSVTVGNDVFLMKECIII